jgi:hypothetical protein
MAVRTLLERAQELVRSRGAHAAVVIVPLALAASAQVNAATFGNVVVSVPNASGLGNLGTAAYTYPGSTDPTGGSQAQLFGATAYGSGTNGSYLTADQVSAAGTLTFQWEGRLNGTIHTNDQIGLAYDFLISVIPHLDPDREPTLTSPGIPFQDPIDWTLSVSSVDNNGDAILDYSKSQSTSFDIQPADFGTAVNQAFDGFTNVKVLQDATDCTWYVTLGVTWQMPNSGDPYYSPTYGADQMSVTIPQFQSIDLSYPSTISPNTLVPLPAAIWAGLPMLGLVAFAVRRVGRRGAAG